MKYEFDIADGPKVRVSITNMQPARLVDSSDDALDGVFRTWDYEGFEGRKPTVAYKVDVADLRFASDLPENGDDDSLDLHAWRSARDRAEIFGTILVEWSDGTVELSLPEHDEGGTPGRIL